MHNSISFYNTLSQKIEKFEPIEKGKVTIYVCGVTPYDTSHLGHAFVFITFDVLIRFLEYKNYQVTYTQNVTDIDDPLIERAHQLHIKWEDLAEKWTKYLLNDFNFLNIKLPNYFVKATEELPTMIKIVKVLLEKKYAYIKEGNVYFSIDSFHKYGALSRCDTKTMLKLSSERGNDIKDPKKKNPLDFLLWKKSIAGEPAWDSPWSKGRPGWHIECTAMSTKYLGQQIDIHGGGTDLIFPHHESEIAQAESYSGKSPFVKTWMHCGMAAFDGEKMSKSLGNLVYVQDLAKDYSANTIRHYLLSHHYRTDWAFSEEEIKESSRKMKKIESSISQSGEIKNANNEYINLLGNDLDTTNALEALLSITDLSKKKELFNILGFK